MKNITELRNELCALFTDLKSGAKTAREATEMTNAAGKALQAIKLQLEYARLREEKPEIEFIK